MNTVVSALDCVQTTSNAEALSGSPAWPPRMPGTGVSVCKFAPGQHPLVWDLDSFITFSLKIRSQRVVGEGWAGWMVGPKEGTCDERWVLSGSDESLKSTLETHTVLLTNQNSNLKKLLKNKHKEITGVFVFAPSGLRW